MRKVGNAGLFYLKEKTSGRINPEASTKTKIN